MAPLYSSADLVQRCRDAAQLPADDEMMTPDAWYRLLTAAQAQWYPQVAAHVPQVAYSAPRLLQSFDGGETFGFGTDGDGRPIIPLGEVQVFRSQDHATQADGALRLRSGVDFLAEATQLRFRLTGARPAWTDGGPWVRMVEPPGVIDAEHEPVFLPTYARELLVLAAVEAWATQGDLRDGSAWRGRAQRYWSGDPANPADVGLLGALKKQFPAAPSWGRVVRVSGRHFWRGVR